MAHLPRDHKWHSPWVFLSLYRNPQCTGPSSRPASHHPHLNANPMGHILYFCHSSTQLQLLVSALVSVLIMSLLPLVLSTVYWKAFSTPLCGEAIWSTQTFRTLGQGRHGEEAHCPSSEWLRHFRSWSVGHTDHRLHFQALSSSRPSSEQMGNRFLSDQKVSTTFISTEL